MLITFSFRYFPTKATQEILDEFTPKLCPFSNSEFNTAIEYLELFLPLNIKPEEANIGYNLWFEEFMHVWEVCHNSNVWENVSVYINIFIGVYYCLQALKFNIKILTTNIM